MRVGRFHRKFGALQGLTLIELMFGLVITGVVVTSAIALLRMQGRSLLRGTYRNEGTQKARFSLDILERELRVIGAGVTAGQPLVVYGDADMIVFNADLATNEADDVIAVYYDPDATDAEVMGPDSAALTLPVGGAYPQVWYGPGSTPGRAEAITLRFVQTAGGSYALTRQVNALDADTLVMGLERPAGGFFSYRAIGQGGRFRVLAMPLVHDAAIHGGTADTGRSARTDSLRNIEIEYTVVVEAPRGERRRMPVRTVVDVRNMGLALHASCGEQPILSSTPALELTVTPGVKVTWNPAFDENGGEEDVRQYNIYRAESLAGPWTPIQAIPIAEVASYTYEDLSVEAGKTYWYALSATDCTPAESEWTYSPGAVTIPPDNPE